MSAENVNGSLAIMPAPPSAVRSEVCCVCVETGFFFLSPRLAVDSPLLIALAGAGIWQGLAHANARLGRGSGNAIGTSVPPFDSIIWHLNVR